MSDSQSQSPVIHTFLYAEQALVELGPKALLPGFRVSFTNRGLPNLEKDDTMVVPGVLWQGVPPPPEIPFKGIQGHAVLAAGEGIGGVVEVLMRTQRRGGEKTSPSRELMEGVRAAAEACAYPLSWITEGLPLDRVEDNFGASVMARVRSVADRVSRGMM